LQFFGAHANLADRDAFAEYLAPSRKVEWVVYSKRPFGGPEAVLAYLSRYTHRVAISNSRLLACDGDGVPFKLHWLKNWGGRSGCSALGSSKLIIADGTCHPVLAFLMVRESTYSRAPRAPRPFRRFLATTDPSSTLSPPITFPV
jgi:hypothetical protein